MCIPFQIKFKFLLYNVFMEKTKEIISIIKNVLNIILTAFLTLIAYLFINVESLSKLRLSIVCLGVVFLAFCLALIVYFLIQNLDKLKE
ncbi:hypothetical protein DMB92_05205 [Campylobacter sp. MIT 99-7217]|nr:hypothetical protein DMB92_05205 [Campylobacter sp. MIT 99-7217]